jgi:AraC-like DNA-binding protein
VPGLAPSCIPDNGWYDQPIGSGRRPVVPMNASCSARLLQPFIEFASANAAYRDLVPEPFWSVDPEARVSLEAVHSMLEGAVERARDDTLGLKLGRRMCLGAGGLFDYGMQSAATLRDALSFAERYMALLSDPLHVGFEIIGTRAAIRLECESPWPRVAADFASSAWYKLHIVGQVPSSAHVECWFPYARPADLGPYERTFDGAVLRFDAPFRGFAFDKTYERAPGPGAEPALHSMLRARLDSLMGHVARTRTMTTAVRRLVVQEIGRENALSESALAKRVATAMRMSRRTLSRKLEQEGTSFFAEADAVRRDMAVAYVLDRRLALTEVAFLLGFSHVESFHRAFKRWTGETPVAYRRANAGRVAAA